MPANYLYKGRAQTGKWKQPSHQARVIIAERGIQVGELWGGEEKAEPEGLRDPVGPAGC